VERITVLFAVIATIVVKTSKRDLQRSRSAKRLLRCSRQRRGKCIYVEHLQPQLRFQKEMYMPAYQILRKPIGLVQHVTR